MTWPAEPPESLTISVPWIPDPRSLPNARNSERTRKRYRKEGATAAIYPCRAARQAIARIGAGPIYTGPVALHILVIWPRSKPGPCPDAQAIITAAKETIDILEREALIANDNQITRIEVDQRKGPGQCGMVLTLRRGAG